MLDVAKLSQKNGIKPIMISNGYINPEPLRELCKYISAIKIDFKGYSEEFYKKIVRGKLEYVLKSMEIIKGENIWMEVVNLVIPTYNDSEKQISKLCKWIVKNLSIDVPVHFSRFHPQYLMKNLPPTPVATLKNAFKIAKSMNLNYVYLGNIPQHKSNHSFCPKCQTLLIERRGYITKITNINKGKCNNCEEIIPGVWE